MSEIPDGKITKSSQDLSAAVRFRERLLFPERR